MYTTVNNCARCGETHESLKFKKFKNPIEDEGGIWEYWVLCPTLQEPIFMKSNWVVAGGDEVIDVSEFIGTNEQITTGHMDADTSKPCGCLE